MRLCFCLNFSLMQLPAASPEANAPAALAPHAHTTLHLLPDTDLHILFFKWTTVEVPEAERLIVPLPSPWTAMRTWPGGGAESQEPPVQLHWAATPTMHRALPLRHPACEQDADQRVIMMLSTLRQPWALNDRSFAPCKVACTVHYPEKCFWWIYSHWRQNLFIM